MPQNLRPLDLRVIATSQLLKLSSDWNTQVEDHVSQLIEKVEARVSVEMDEASHKSRRAASEALNQLMRRLRQCRSAEEVAAWMVDSSASFCGRAALFEVIEKRVRAVRSRGFQLACDAAIEELEAPLDMAPAFAQAVLERDTVIARASPAEVSLQVVAILGSAPTEKVHLYPVVIQERAVAILYAAGTVDGAGLEFLTQAAAYAVEVLAPEESAATRPASSFELISIEGVNMRAHTSRPSGMLGQALEARARWFARTEVARIRLFHGTALEQGRMQRNIYGTLRVTIDAARRSYQQDFLAVSPAIADYLHRELLELAHDDANLLGPDYPGSLV